MPADSPHPPHCVIIPFYQRLDQVAACLAALLQQLQPDSRILLVNDGTPLAQVEAALAQYLPHPAVTLLHLENNQGVAAARNHAVNWCRRQHMELLIMIDSDCLPGEDFLAAHLALHRQHPRAACCGGAVVGSGAGIWARLDKLMSWVHSIPFGPLREVKPPYHLPTTNFSVKMRALPAAQPAFDARLHSGEDALLIRNFRARGLAVLFSPQPVVKHRDRERPGEVIRHHYRWGYHQYFIQLGGDIAERCFKPGYRIIFLLLFLPCLPLYALLGSLLNVTPWLRHKPGYVLFWPAMYGLWLAKAVAVAEAAWRPRQCLRTVAATAAAPRVFEPPAPPAG